MARVLTALVLGVLLGATAAWLLRPSSLALPDLGELQPPIIATAPVVEAVVTAAAREGGADFYRQLADANTSELAAMIRQAAAEPSSTERELALAVLLKRQSELDALGAVRLAREADVGGMALSAVYSAWARKAPGQALAALSTVENPDAAAAVAVALVGALGDNAAAFDRVSKVLAAREDEEPFTNAPATPFTPAGAPASVVSARSALGLTVQKWADLDPRRAIAVAQQVDDERLGLALESAALRALSRAAPDEAFARLAALDGDSRQINVLSGVWGELARADPERLLASAASLPVEARRMAEQMAIQQLADRDPLAAIRYLERMPFSPERQGIMQVVARSYGKRDPAAALAWARSLPGKEEIIAAVISGLAEQDPQRAMDLAFSLTAPNERMRAVQYLAMTGSRADATMEMIANRLLTSDDRQLRESTAPMLVSMWSARSPESAMRWLLANGQSASPALFMQVGQQMAMRDPRNALAQSTQIPAAVREQWMQGVAQGYAQNDPQGAIDWLAQYRAEPWYTSAATNAAMQLAQRDGAAAARLVDRIDTERSGQQAQRLVSVVAQGWANQDPLAAAEWAMDRANPQERTMAIQSVARIWSQQDPAGARQWALRLPQGTTRDGALTTMFQATVSRGNGSLDTGLLNAFSSDAARQQAVMQVVQGLAYSDPARARATVETYLTDPALRAQGERAIEAARNDPRRGSPQFIPSGVIMTTP